MDSRTVVILHSRSEQLYLHCAPPLFRTFSLEKGSCVLHILHVLMPLTVNVILQAVLTNTVLLPRDPQK